MHALAILLKENGREMLARYTVYTYIYILASEYTYVLPLNLKRLGHEMIIFRRSIKLNQ